MSRRRPGGRAVLISAAAHAALLVPLVVLARPPEPVEFETVRINLVSPPPADVAHAEAEPTPTPPAPEPDPGQEQPEPEAEEPEQEEPPPEPPPENVERPQTERPETERPETPPSQQPEPRETEEAPEATTGGDDIQVQVEGFESAYPDYMNNIVRQLYRFFRWRSDSNPVGTVYFEILPDGSVRDIRMVEPSGNYPFDIAVQGAVETAGSRRAFGPLPDGFAAPYLPVELVVEPPR